MEKLLQFSEQVQVSVSAIHYRGSVGVTMGAGCHDSVVRGVLLRNWAAPRPRDAPKKSLLTPKMDTTGQHQAWMILIRTLGKARTDDFKIDLLALHVQMLAILQTD